MTLEELLHKLRDLTANERREVARELARIELEKDEEYWGVVRRRSEDRNPEHWVSGEELFSGEA